VMAYALASSSLPCINRHRNAPRATLSHTRTIATRLRASPQLLCECNKALSQHTYPVRGGVFSVAAVLPCLPLRCAHELWSVAYSVALVEFNSGGRPSVDGVDPPPSVALQPSRVHPQTSTGPCRRPPVSSVWGEAAHMAPAGRSPPHRRVGGMRTFAAA
jgi:hypothetical protein